MATNLAKNDKLKHKASESSRLKTKKGAVNPALKEFVDRHKQLEIIKIFGKMDPDSNYDYKNGRTR